MKISKILTIMGSIFMVLILSIAVSMVSLGDASQVSEEAMNRQIEAKELGFQLKDSSDYVEDLMQNYVQYGEQEYLDKYNEEFEVTKTTEKVLERLEEMKIPDDLMTIITEATNAYGDLVALEERAMSAVDNGNLEQAREIIFSDQYDAEMDAINQPIFEFIDKMDTYVANEVQKSRDKTNNIRIFIAVEMFLISALIIYTFIILIKKIRNLSQVSEKLRDLSNNEGDLTVRVNVADGGNDEISEISHSFNHMLDSFQAMIREIRDTNKDINEKSHQFDRATDISREGNSQIAAAMEEMATGSEEQANLSTQVAQSTHELNDSITNLKTEGEDLQHSSETILDITENGSSQMQETITQVITVNEIIKNATENLKDLESKSQEISTLIQVINDISEQTNLLALNAAIEAARAGEFGKGFAVVADEIRKLSEQVGISVGDITTIVKDIQGETDNMASVLGEGYEEVKEGTDKIKATGQTFETINTRVSQMAEKIDRVYFGLEQMSQNGESINDSMDNVAAILEENTAGIEEVAATTLEQGDSEQMISDGARDLLLLSERLDSVIGKFKID